MSVERYFKGHQEKDAWDAQGLRGGALQDTNNKRLVLIAGIWPWQLPGHEQPRTRCAGGEIYAVYCQGCAGKAAVCPGEKAPGKTYSTRNSYNAGMRANKERECRLWSTH